MKYKTILAIFLIVFVLGVVAIFAALRNLSSLPNGSQGSNSQIANDTSQQTEFEPSFATETILSGITKPWDINFIDDDTFIYNLKEGEVRVHKISTNEDWLLYELQEVYNVGEGGLLGGLTDHRFEENGYYYICSNVSGPSVSVIRLKINGELTQIQERSDIITGIPSKQSGRHSGCRIAMASNGHLWVGTGDIAVGTNPQDPKNLGGKILRVDRVGSPVQGNLTGEFDPRIFSYGHRNTQGIVLFDKEINGVYGFSSEHGSDRDDEINLLKNGNFGWDPVPGYNEEVNMTDLEKFPDAIPAIWSSGNPTIAVSGMAIIKGPQWGKWDGAIALAVQKDRHIRIIKFDGNYEIVLEEEILNGEFGRIRTVKQAPNGDLFFLTDNGASSDRIVRLKPSK